MQRFVLPANADPAWGALKHETPPHPRLPARRERAPKVKSEPHAVHDLALPPAPAPEPEIKRRGSRQNRCLACRRPFTQSQGRYKLVHMPTGTRSVMSTGLGVDFCDECGPKAIEAIEAYFGGTSFVYR